MSYQTQKFREARTSLMLPHERGEASSISECFSNIDLGLYDYHVPEDFNEDAVRHLRELKVFMNTDGVEDPLGRGRWIVKAEQFDSGQKARISILVDELAWWFEQYDQLHGA